ncbi:prolyl oligopeptidase family protein [Tanacetum coccineum]|uniref:Prolyl endopeptidase n=1 Tax=Tanacetum coccineum TaxID=301880 RepID=A0ABQ5CJ55_9ASTR
MGEHRDMRGIACAHAASYPRARYNSGVSAQAVSNSESGSALHRTDCNSYQIWMLEFTSDATYICSQVCVDPSFKASRLSLLDRGFTFAIAHIRGGGEMGRKWYENGKYLQKKNTFTDFIDCAEYLIEKKYCTKDKLCINGRSAGGLLIGAVLNMRPDLFKAAVAGVPFVDVVTTMLDPTIPLTTAEWEVFHVTFLKVQH